jgi:RimJ/RimL family protein N-acetyltransferase
MEPTLPNKVNWNGEDLVLRPIRLGDASQHLAFLSAVDPEDLRLRLHSGRRELLPGELVHLTDLDDAREAAFVAVSSAATEADETLGVVRAVWDANKEEADLGMLVRSDKQGRGLGDLLLARMIDYLRARGIGRIVASVLRENRAMRDLANAHGFSQQGESDAADPIRFVRDLFSNGEGIEPKST